MSMPIDAALPDETPAGVGEIGHVEVPPQVDEDNVPIKDVGTANDQTG